MKYIIALILIILMFTMYPQKESPTVLKRSDSILAMGDSLTYGHGANPSQSYPSILSKLTGLHVINAGINAESSEDGLKRLPPLLKDESIKLMILCMGGNDILQSKPMATLKQNLKTMIRQAKEKNIKVLLISVPNFNLFGFTPLALYDEVANEENIPLASGILADILAHPSLKSDQIHPNALGYKQMAEKIYEQLKEEGFLED